jgi:hypothetical protein
MQTQFRPYSMIVQLDSISPSALVLRDTAGDPLKCNFISVEASGEDTDSWFGVQYNPGDSTGFTTTPIAGSVSAGTAVGVTASGVVGGFATTQKGIVEFLLADADRVNTITLGISSAQPCKLFVTYGQIQAGNVMRDNERLVGS